MLLNLGMVMVKYRWLVIGSWALVFLLAAVTAPRLFGELQAGFGRANTESQKALDLLRERMDENEAVLTVVFSHPVLEVFDPEFQQAMAMTLSAVDQLPGIVNTVTVYSSGNLNLVSPDRHTTYGFVEMVGSLDDGVDRYHEIRDLLKPPEGFDLLATGGIAIFAELNEAAEEDLRRSEAVSFPLVLVALAIIFGTIIASLMPIFMAVVVVTITMASVFFLTYVTDVSIFVLNIASFLGIGISIDYTLLIISRFREELEYRDVSDAVGNTMATAGRAVLFSGITTIVGLSGLFFLPFMFFRSLGIGGVTVVAISMAVVLTLVPAVLGYLGHRINRFRVLPFGSPSRGFWNGIARRVMRHPLLVAIPVMVFLLLLGTPFLGLNLGAPWASVLPTDSEPRLGWEKLEREFGAGEVAPIVVVAQAQGDFLDSKVIGALYDWSQKISEDPRVSRIESIVTLDPAIGKAQYQQMYESPDQIPIPAAKEALDELVSGDVGLVRVFPKTGLFAPDTKALVEDLKNKPIAPNVQLLLTGATADMQDTISLMYRYFPWIIAYVVVVTYLVLMVLFQSVVLPIKAVIMNAMSIFAVYGALVFIFQEGNLEGLLRFSSTGFLEVTLPITLFCIVFGLSMDYEVFLLSRIKERYDETRDNTESVAFGLERTGRLITSAAMILVLVAIAFTTSDIIVVKAFGVGIALAIFLDATLVRVLLVPALMRIMGDVNWWAPNWLRRILVRGRLVG